MNEFQVSACLVRKTFGLFRKRVFCRIVTVLGHKHRLLHEEFQQFS